MEVNEIKWDRIKKTIGRWTATEAHDGQVKYELTSRLHDPFTIIEFTVDFEAEEVSEGVTDDGAEFPLTDEERREAERMIANMKR